MLTTKTTSTPEKKMNFKKLLLATAITTISSASFAMQAMDEEALSETTGQDGLTITIEPPSAGITADIVIHDKDGLAGIVGSGSTLLNSGAILFDGFALNPNGATSTISIVIDATGDALAAAGTDPQLNIDITLPGSTVISTGAVFVADSNGVGVAIGTTQETILANMNITLLGATLINMQLGNERTGDSMINVSTTITGGLSISDFRLEDADDNGSINSDLITIKNQANADLTADVGVDATASGLQITMAQFGSGAGVNISMTSVGLGADGTPTNSIGDIDLLGLDLDGTTITISGH